MNQNAFFTQSQDHTHLTAGHKGRRGKLKNQSTALKHARNPVLLLSISVRANITKRKPGVKTRARLMSAKLMSPGTPPEGEVERRTRMNDSQEDGE